MMPPLLLVLIIMMDIQHCCPLRQQSLIWVVCYMLHWHILHRPCELPL